MSAPNDTTTQRRRRIRREPDLNGPLPTDLPEEIAKFEQSAGDQTTEATKQRPTMGDVYGPDYPAICRQTLEGTVDKYGLVLWMGRSQFIEQWAKEAGIPLPLVATRLALKWSIAEALLTPPGPPEKGAPQPPRSAKQRRLMRELIGIRETLLEQRPTS